MEVRQLVPQDEVAYLRLLSAVKQGECHLQLEEHHIGNVLDLDGEYVLGIIYNEQLVATATLLFDKCFWVEAMEASNVATGSGCKIAHVMVHPEFRRLGLGEILAKMMVAVARKEHREYLFAETSALDVAMHRVLNRLGAQRKGDVGTGDNRRTVHCLRVQKSPVFMEDKNVW